MQPVSYTSLKIVHEQMIQEMLEQRRGLTAPDSTPQRLLRQTFGTVLARLTNRSDQSPQAVVPDGHAELESSVP